MDFEIEKIERFYFKINEKNNIGDFKSDILGIRGFFLWFDDILFWWLCGLNKDLIEIGNWN